MQRLDITVRKGATVEVPIRVESSVLRYATITAITRAAPTVVTAPLHGMPTIWRSAIVSAQGMTQINAKRSPPSNAELRPCKATDANTVEFNALNAAGFNAYTGGGYVCYYEPLDLSPYDRARMNVRDRLTGALLELFTTENGALEISYAERALWLRKPAVDSAAWTFADGNFDIELVNTSTGFVLPICNAESRFVALPEITTQHE